MYGADLGARKSFEKTIFFACSSSLKTSQRTAPLTLRLEAISSLHCVISWIPINSNFRHKVYVNNIEREILPPGFYMTRINQLEPERNYVIQVESIVNAGSVDQSSQARDFRFFCTII